MARLSPTKSVTSTGVKSVGIHEAKTNFSSLVKAVEDGEEIVVRRGSRPVVKIVRFVEERPKRTAGDLRGQIRIGPDFDAIPPEFEEYA